MHEPVLAADQNVSASPAAEVIVACLAEQDVVAGTAFEAIFAVAAVQPRGDRDGGGNLDVVVAGLAEGDKAADPVRGTEGPQERAVEDHLDPARVARGDE